MQLSQKQKSFSQFFLHFQNSYPLLNICQKKMTFIAEAIPQIPAPWNMVISMSKKSFFTGPIHRQQDKWVEIRLESERQYLYNIY